MREGWAIFDFIPSHCLQILWRWKEVIAWFSSSNWNINTYVYSRLAEWIKHVWFLRNALLQKNWARQHPYIIGKGTEFRELQTLLASAQQIHEEALTRSGNGSNAGPSTFSGWKRTTLFSVPKYAKRVTKNYFLDQIEIAIVGTADNRKIDKFVAASH